MIPTSVGEGFPCALSMLACGHRAEPDLAPLGLIAAIGAISAAIVSVKTERYLPPSDCPKIPRANCASCEYDLAGLPHAGVCPECGGAYEPAPAVGGEQLVWSLRTDRLPWVLAALVLPWLATLGAVPLALLLTPDMAGPLGLWREIAGAWSWGCMLDVFAAMLPLSLGLVVLTRFGRGLLWCVMAAGVVGGYAGVLAMAGPHVHSYAQCLDFTGSHTVIGSRPVAEMSSTSLLAGLAAMVAWAGVRAAITQIRRAPASVSGDAHATLAHAPVQEC